VDPSIPAAVSDVVMRALQKDPDTRFQNLADMRAALQAAQEGGPAPWEDRTIAVRRGDVPQAPGALDFLFEKPPDAYQSVMSTDFLTSDAAKALRESMDQMFDTPPPTPQPESSASPETQVPPSQIFDPPAEPAAPPPTVSEVRPATVVKPPATSRPPSTTSRPLTMMRSTTWTPSARPPVPPAARTASGRSGKRIGVAVVLFVVAGAAMVAIPRLTEQPDPADVERPRVVAALETFRSAYRTKNLSGVAAVFPSLPRDLRQRMQAAFKRCLLYDVRFSDMQVDLNPQATAAKVSVTSEHECTPNSNEPYSTTTEQDVFTLSRDGEAWRIDSLARSR
jgi:hypothetical protein